MTLQELIDELQALPLPCRTARVIVSSPSSYVDIESVRYEGGEVAILIEEDTNDRA